MGFIRLCTLITQYVRNDINNVRHCGQCFNRRSATQCVAGRVSRGGENGDETRAEGHTLTVFHQHLG